MSEALQPLGPPPPTAIPDPADVLPLPLPPTSGPSLGEPPVTAPPAAPPAAPAAEEPPVRTPEPADDDVEALRAKVAEQAKVIELAKTRVETLVAEKRDAYEREQALQQHIRSLEAELAKALTSAPPDAPTLASLAARVAALEAAVVQQPR